MTLPKPCNAMLPCSHVCAFQPECPSAPYLAPCLFKFYAALPCRPAVPTTPRACRAPTRTTRASLPQAHGARSAGFASNAASHQPPASPQTSALSWAAQRPPQPQGPPAADPRAAPPQARPAHSETSPCPQAPHPQGL